MNGAQFSVWWSSFCKQIPGSIWNVNNHESACSAPLCIAGCWILKTKNQKSSAWQHFNTELWSLTLKLIINGSEYAPNAAELNLVSPDVSSLWRKWCPWTRRARPATVCWRPRGATCCWNIRAATHWWGSLWTTRQPSGWGWRCLVVRIPATLWASPSGSTVWTTRPMHFRYVGGYRRE